AAGRTAHGRRGGRSGQGFGLFHHQPVLPVVAHVVDVADGILGFAQHFAHRYLARVAPPLGHKILLAGLHGRRAAEEIIEAAPPSAKFKQVRVFPAKG
nr:hypothetical protein [Tanacetum cinerariifolium]